MTPSRFENHADRPKAKALVTISGYRRATCTETASSAIGNITKFQSTRAVTEYGTKKHSAKIMHLVQTHRIIFTLLAIFCCTSSHGQTQAPATVTPPARKEAFHLYLLMGQSNMAGRDTRTLASQVENPRVLTLNADGQWVVARDPLHARDGRTEPGAGPGIPFALGMLEADPQATIGLIPCAVGGSPLRRWVKGADLYEKAVNRAKIAAEVGVIQGVLWHQGETDTAKKETAETYQDRLTQMFKDLRTDLGQPELPIVVGQLGDFLALSPAKYPYAEIVRAAIRQMPAGLPNVAYADSAGLGDKGDKLHFDADGAKELGARYAKAMRHLALPSSQTLLKSAPKVPTAEPLPATVFKKLQAGTKQTVIVYGTSLTIKGEWTKALNAYFDQQFPGLVTFHNSAKSGMHSDWGVANLQERVLSKNPDLVFIEFSINDAATKNNVSLEQSLTNLDHMVDAIRRQNPQADIVLQTMDCAWDSPRVPDKQYGSDRPNLEAYYEVYRSYARTHHLPLIDNYPNWLKIQKDEPLRYQKMVPDGIHPSSTSSLAVTWPAIETLLEKARGNSPTNHGAVTDRTVPRARIARFLGDRAAAVSYTFDDGLRDQYTLAVPMLNEVGFKGTFFVIPGSTAETPEQAVLKQSDKRPWGGISWPELKEMAAQGHEIASHTWSHRSLPKLAHEEVITELTKSNEVIQTHLGRPPLTLAFPFNQSTPEVQAAALKYHVAYRAYQLGIGGKSTVESLNTWANKQIRDQTWGIVMAHAIAHGYAALSDPEIFRAHLSYVKSRERDIWVGTFADIARYEKERDDAKLEISGSVGQLTCQLSGTLDPKTFDIPLTIVIDAITAKSVRAQRAGQDLPVHTDRGSIQVDATPSSQPITIIWQ